MIVLPKTVRDVGESLSTAYAQGRLENRKVLLKILQNVKFLGRQGLAFRGHDDAESNFMQLFKFRELDNPELSTWLKRADKYLSPEIQNEMLQLMSVSILRCIASNLPTSSMFTIMADECTDISNHEQLVICFRWVDTNLEVHEEFAGLYQIADTSANTILQALKDCLLRMNLQWKHCRGQCYDGAANMAGLRNGVAAQILRLEPRALYTHCYGHSLNLAMCDTIKQSKLTRDVMDVTYEISRLLKFSPKRNAIFDKLKEELSPDSPGFRVLCPTRWTVRAKSLQSVQKNYAVLQELWSIVLEGNVEPDVRARVIGVQAQMESFDYFFGISVAELVLNHGDNLSAALQSSTISAAEGQHIASLTATTLANLRTDENFLLFWDLVQKKAAALHVTEPRLPRRRKAPQRYEAGSGLAHFPDTVEDYYRRIFFEVLDSAVSTIKDRFDQPNYEIYKQAENLLLKTVRGEDASNELATVTNFFGDDFNQDRLPTQLMSLSVQFEGQKDLNLRDVVVYLRDFSPAERIIFSEVVMLLKIILVAPATNAISERSFSAMRRLKTYLRSTMQQKRLNAVMMLHIHKEMCDQLSVVELANMFASTEHRRSLFGQFLKKALYHYT